MNYYSDVALSLEYVDQLTGLRGVATAIAFYPEGPERVQLSTVGKEGSVLREWFDGPSLARV